VEGPEWGALPSRRGSHLNAGYPNLAPKSRPATTRPGPSDGVSQRGALRNLFLPTPSGPSADSLVLAEKLRKPTFGHHELLHAMTWFVTVVAITASAAAPCLPTGAVARPPLNSSVPTRQEHKRL
jgi:hypothetical protein